MARFTGSGAFFGAAAWPKRSRATLPEMTGPFVGKRSADADGRINPEMMTPSRIWLLTGWINSSGGVFYKMKAACEKKIFRNVFQGMMPFGRQIVAVSDSSAGALAKEDVLSGVYERQARCLCYA